MRSLTRIFGDARIFGDVVCYFTIFMTFGDEGLNAKSISHSSNSVISSRLAVLACPFFSTFPNSMLSNISLCTYPYHIGSLMITE